MKQTDQMILCLLYLILSIFIGLTLIKGINKEKKISIISFFKIFYMIVYAIVPIIFISNANRSDYNIYLINFDNISKFYILYFATLIFYVIFSLFLNLKFKNEKIDVEKKYEIDIQSKNFMIINTAITFIGFISMILWTKVYGNPWNIVKYASRIRSGYIDIPNPFTFLKPFCYFSIISFYNSLLLLRTHKKTFLSFLCLIVSLFSSIILILGNDGRMLMLIFILVIILYFFNKKKIYIKISIFFKYAFLAVVTIFLLANLDAITSYIKDGHNFKLKNASIIKTVNDEFGYTYANGVNLIESIITYKYIGSTELSDLKNIVLSWVPSSIKSNFVVNLFDYNTKMFYSGFIGQIPSDLLTSSLYKFGFMGILIMPIFLVIILKKVEHFFFKYKSESMELLYNLVGLYIGLRLIAYYDLSTILFGCFYIFITTWLILFFCKRGVKNGE